MKWTDTQDIAMALTDKHPEIDPQQEIGVDQGHLVVDADIPIVGGQLQM